jgi:6-phospho-3-hexuloisomerase
MSALSFTAMKPQAVAEIQAALDGIDPQAADALVDAILDAGRITCWGMGREGLMLRAFTMRLMHLGFDAHFAGDVTAKAIGPGDLALFSSGPGDLVVHQAMVDVANRSGAKLALMTAQPDRRNAATADLVIHLPAQTMANDQAAAALLPMGTTYEIAQLIFLDLVAISLRERTGQTLDEVRARHTNLE